MLFLGASIIHSALFNNWRLVKPTDVSTYVFSPMDLPMIISIGLVIIYVVFCVISLIKAVISERNRHDNNRTRALNPKLGWLGFAGFLGFIGFLTYSIDKTIFPFTFFVFFGFFGFYFEGKMSNTLRDERLQENRDKAQLEALKIGIRIIFIIVLLVGMGVFSHNLEHCAIFFVSSSSLTLAITMFLSEYLLYKYDL